jgi:Bacterial CdiA-CT RNAse A domain
MPRLTRLVAIALVLLVGFVLWSRSRAPQVVAPRPAPRADVARGTPRPAPAPAPGPAPAETAAADGERHDLDQDEARGGHTLARHVGRTDAQLRERLANEPNISTASTYATRALAERTVARTLRDNDNRVQTWSSRRGRRPNLALDYHGRRSEVLGRCMRRGREAIDCSDAVVVLRWDDGSFYVLTTYPEPPR